MDGKEARSRNYDQRFNDLDERVCALEKGHNEQHRKLERLGDQFELLRRLFVEVVQQTPKCGCNELLEAIVCKLDEIAAALSGSDNEQHGHFSMHVTEVQLNKEDSMPAVDTTPDLDLAASNVRAKISVVGPKATPDGPYLTNAEVTWAASAESEPGALVLEPAPESIQYEVDGTTPVLDAAGNQIPVYSTFANTPLEPAEGSRVSGIVTVSGPGMASRTKKVSYGNAAVGHFTMEGVEAPEA